MIRSQPENVLCLVCLVFHLELDLNSHPHDILFMKKKELVEKEWGPLICNGHMVLWECSVHRESSKS